MSPTDILSGPDPDELDYSEESFSIELYQEIRELAGPHEQESVTFDGLKPDPDQSLYAEAAYMGLLRIYCARRGGLLMGYAVFFLSPHPHYRGQVFATQNLIYLVPDERKGSTGTRFLRWCDAQLKAAGAVVVHHYSGLKKDISSVLLRSGYKMIETLWAKKL
jgi:hypothetical protein